MYRKIIFSTILVTAGLLAFAYPLKPIQVSAAGIVKVGAPCNFRHAWENRVPTLAEVNQNRDHWHHNDGGDSLDDHGRSVDLMANGYASIGGDGTGRPFMSCGTDTRALAAIAGRVEYASGYGTTLKIVGDNGVTVLYGHLANILVANGTKVTVGQHIATIGATGYAQGVHIHFNVYQNGGRLSYSSKYSSLPNQWEFAPASEVNINQCPSPALPGCGSAKAIKGISVGNTPAPIGFNNKLFVAFKSADASNKLYMTNLNAKNIWLTPARAYDKLTFQGSPAVAQFNGKVYMAFRANDPSGSLYVTSSTDGVNWQQPARKIPGVIFQDDPAMVAFNGRLYIAFRSFDSSNTLYMISSADGVNWGSAKHYPGFKFQGSPALAVFKNRMYIAFRANDPSNSLYFALSADGRNWPASATKANGISLSGNPTMAVLGNRLYLAFKANDSSNILYVTNTSTGTSWNSAVGYKNIKLGSSPRMVAAKRPVSADTTSLYMVFRANDSSNLLYFTHSMNGVSWMGI